MTCVGITAVQSYGADMIYACVSKSGQIRIVNSADGCKKNESSVQWEFGESGLNRLYNTWVTYQAVDSKRVENGAVCGDGDMLISGGCECAPISSNCITVLETSTPMRSDIDGDGIIENWWKCACVNPLGIPCDYIGVMAQARCAEQNPE